MGRPEVVVNMAMTADGKIATAGREVTTFGSPLDLDGLYRLRASADAILCGARTVEETGATLGSGGVKYERIRVEAQRDPLPLRVVVSGQGSLSPQARIWTESRSPIVVLTHKGASSENRIRLRNLGAQVWSSANEGLDLAAAMRWLFAEKGVRRLVCEGGGRLNASLFEADLVDELHLTLCPRVFGGRSAPSIADGDLGLLENPARWMRPRMKRVGEELFLVWKRRRA